MIEEETLKDGMYPGIWEGHEFEFDYFGAYVTVNTVVGIRGIDRDAVLEFKCGNFLYVESCGVENDVIGWIRTSDKPRLRVL